MRWNSQDGSKEGERRTVSRFLLFPKRIGHEWRWLEKASIVQEWAVYVSYDPDTGVEQFLYWDDVAWAKE